MENGMYVHKPNVIDYKKTASVRISEYVQNTKLEAFDTIMALFP